MSIDWEYFFKHGYNPALKSLQDYQRFTQQGLLSKQGHKQRMTEMSTEYGFRRGETEQQMQWRVKLAGINANIDRSLAVDKDYLQRGRLQLSHELQTERQDQSFNNQRDLAKIYSEGGIKRAEVYRDIAKMNSGLSNMMQYDPNSVGTVNQTTWNNLKSHRQDLMQEIQGSEMVINEIMGNPLFSKIHIGTLSEEAQGADWNSEEFSWYKEKIKQLSDDQKKAKEARNALLMVDREIVKFGMDAKITNPVTMEEAEAIIFNQIGFPLPANMAKPQAVKDMGEHLKAVEYLVMNGKDLPQDQDILEKGFDVEWMKANWPQYRDFYRGRLAQQLKNMGQETLGGLGESAKKLGELLSTFIF